MWMYLTDYTYCQALAETARAAGIEIICYASVRDSDHGMNLVLLTCLAFARARPVDLQTWRIRVSDTGIQAICESSKSGITFGRESFAANRRVATPPLGSRLNVSRGLCTAIGRWCSACGGQTQPGSHFRPSGSRAALWCIGRRQGEPRRRDTRLLHRPSNVLIHLNFSWHPTSS